MLGRRKYEHPKHVAPVDNGLLGRYLSLGRGEDSRYPMTDEVTATRHAISHAD
jgi:hypothetical protein